MRSGGMKERDARAGWTEREWSVYYSLSQMEPLRETNDADEFDFVRYTMAGE